MPMLRFPVPLVEGSLDVHVPEGGALFIVGRNGTGKSALVHLLCTACRKQTPNGVVYLPGSRPSYFDSDSLNMTANARYQFEVNSAGWDASPDIRIRPISGTSRNERAIFDLQTAELQYRVDAAKEIERDGIKSDAIARLQSRSSPLDRVNRLLEQANLPIRVLIDQGELRVRRGAAVYSISKMSDGERAALIMIADVMAAKSGATFVIDEPELHLHRAIIVPLLSALLAERSDCTAIVSTHELALVNEYSNGQILIVRGCEWVGSSITSWDAAILPSPRDIPEDIKLDLLGSRHSVLFIEGKKSGRDELIYSTIFPNISLSYRASCVDVRRAVVGLRQIEGLHHVRAFGLVDNDGMDREFVEKLIEEGVYPLSVFSVESLYYAPESIAEVACRQGSMLSIDPDELVSNARDKALQTLRQAGKAEHLASRVAERQMRDKILLNMPSRDELMKHGDKPIEISFESTYPKALENLKNLIMKENLDSIISSFPVRETGILDDIAKSLRFLGAIDYERAVLSAISANRELADAVRAKLGPLVEHLS